VEDPSAEQAVGTLTVPEIAVDVFLRNGGRNLTVSMWEIENTDWHDWFKSYGAFNSLPTLEELAPNQDIGAMIAASVRKYVSGPAGMARLAELTVELDAANTAILERDIKIDNLESPYDNMESEESTAVEGAETNPTLKTIVAKWEDAWETARGHDDDGASLSFSRFLNGDITDFSTHNCITVTPYEWFSAADGRDWCVPFEQGAGNTDQQRAWALTGEEQAFVLSNFELFAAHFEAAQPRLVRQNAVTEDEDFDGGDESDSDSEYEQRSVLAELDRSIAAMAEDEAMVSMEVSNALRVSAKLATAWRMNPPKTEGEAESFKRYGDIADFGLERAKRLRVQ
jgi:hypothetical protein